MGARDFFVTFVGTAAISLTLLPGALADPLTDFCNSVWCEALLILVFVVISLVSRYYKSKKEKEARERALTPQTGMPSASRAQKQGSYNAGSTPVPMSYAERASDYSDTSPESSYSPILQVSAGRRYQQAANPGQCPRCGSNNVQSFGTGENKCLDCKKIYYTGR